MRLIDTATNSWNVDSYLDSCENAFKDLSNTIHFARRKLAAYSDLTHPYRRFYVTMVMSGWVYDCLIRIIFICEF